MFYGLTKNTIEDGFDPTHSTSRSEGLSESPVSHPLYDVELKASKYFIYFTQTFLAHYERSGRHPDKRNCIAKGLFPSRYSFGGSFKVIEQINWIQE